MNKWAGGLIVLFGVAHTLGALTVLGAANHADTWISGELWTQDLTDMSSAMSAYWLSMNSFGPPFIVIGATVLWLDRRGITPPLFIAWTLAAWTVLDCILAGPGFGQGLIVLVAAGLLITAAHRATSSERTRRTTLSASATDTDSGARR
ncbi:DUF6463 family protein [Microbacterium sp.]|uniref:DUF6463 family protein n=1 Tax=Microbacterium sp. TaxID=51671 RepID=UPI002732DCBC|nr:DUF6463 family protein [Microbacterium sp.]MDP3952445.1 DUF6463 family protein [Microbacterium sp.]